MTLPPFYAHRFGRSYGPDSAASTLSRALDERLDGLETDCCLTADGELVLLHDPLLSHGTTIDGWVHESQSAEILRAHILDQDGKVTDETPLLLEDGLMLLKGRRLTVQLEAKAFCDKDLATRTSLAICKRLEEEPPPDGLEIEVISFWPEAVAAAAARGHRARLIVACPYTPSALREWAIKHEVFGIILEAYYWDTPHVAIWRDAGLSMMSGVCNDIQLLRRLLPLKPDAVASDRPHELRREALGDKSPS